ncbi:hypothetical protein Shyhy01_13360 [Streptomyces hygroscopicus subsp. hygroscopicus]|nr:hypothetical protein Shyhy01_13360 [Streptomyces hygroscopicus subsp. hygroscopicus]
MTPGPGHLRRRYRTATADPVGRRQAAICPAPPRETGVRSRPSEPSPGHARQDVGGHLGDRNVPPATPGRKSATTPAEPARPPPPEASDGDRGPGRQAAGGRRQAAVCPGPPRETGVRSRPSEPSPGHARQDVGGHLGDHNVPPAMPGRKSATTPAEPARPPPPEASGAGRGRPLGGGGRPFVARPRPSVARRAPLIDKSLTGTPRRGTDAAQ